MKGAQEQLQQPAPPSVSQDDREEKRLGKTVKEAEKCPSPPAASPLCERAIVEKPTRTSLRAHVTSTIQYLATEVTARSSRSGRSRGGPRSRSSASRTSQTSSQATAAPLPPLTHARPPASPEEVDEQLDRILYAIGQLQQLQRRGRYIAAREVRNLRRAFLFAVGEEQLYRAAVQAEGEGSAVMSTASSAPMTPNVAAKKAEHGQSDAEKSRKPETPERPLGALQTSQHSKQKEEEKRNERTAGVVVTDKQASTQTAYPADVESPVAQQQQLTEKSTMEYSPKAAAADRLLLALEHYVDQTPTSSSFEVNGARFSWRSVIHTPCERRLQSLVTSAFIFFTGIPISLSISVLLLTCRYTAPFMIIYLIWIFTFGRPRHPLPKNRCFTNFFLWRYYRDYFPIRLIVPKSVRRKFDKERNYFFVYHPHGIHGFGTIINFGLETNNVFELLPGIVIHPQTLKVNMFIPFWRHLAIWMGCGDASASCIRKTLRAGPGHSVMLVVGGAEESLMTKPNANDLLLLKRKGFIKIALQEGTPLVPVYGFGENNVYNVADIANEPVVHRVLKSFQKYLGFAIPLVKGRGFFNFSYGVLPLRRPIVVVMGEPIEVPLIAKPTAEDLDTWQAKYIEGLKKLYDEHRGIYDLEATGLRIMQ